MSPKDEAPQADAGEPKPEPTSKPKIIVDEDWKSQVQAEKETAQKGDAQASSTADKPKPESAAGGSSPRRLPPASFATLVTSLATQAVAAMGQMPGPDGKPLSADQNLARHLIDTLEILGEKTKGNLDADEAKLLSNIQHELRMLFIAQK